MKITYKFVPMQGYVGSLLIATTRHASGLGLLFDIANGEGKIVYRKAASTISSNGKSIWQLAAHYYASGSQYYAYGTEEELLAAFPNAVNDVQEESLRECRKKDIVSALRINYGGEKTGLKWLIKKKATAK